MPFIESIDAHRLEVPLTTPYRLSFGPVDRYDTIIVEVRDSEGRTGFGEATLLTGYTDERIADSWSLAAGLTEALCGRTIDASQAMLERRVARAPFVVTAFRTALEMATGHRSLDVAEMARIPILGLLQGEDEPTLRDAFEHLLDEGYRTVKIKVGFDVDRDVRFVQTVQRIVAGRVQIRVDANQGYDARQATAFVRAIDPAGVELFEQPCSAGDWVAHRKVVEAAARTGLPLMLDESIYGMADIERAAQEGACRYLKVKLMKFGGLTALTAAIERIRALGRVPVLGNGVACDVSCWMEACIAARLIDNAGEMNGFRKASPMLLDPPLAFEAGHVVLRPGIVPRLETRALERYRLDRVTRRSGSPA